MLITRGFGIGGGEDTMTGFGFAVELDDETTTDLEIDEILEIELELNEMQ